jgi:CRP-like cAMP-binding protein
MLPLKRKELAAVIGVSPEHLSRTLSELAADGVIELRGQWIVIRDSKKLEVA